MNWQALIVPIACCFAAAMALGEARRARAEAEQTRKVLRRYARLQSNRYQGLKLAVEESLVLGSRFLLELEEPPVLPFRGATMLNENDPLLSGRH